MVAVLKAKKLGSVRPDACIIASHAAASCAVYCRDSCSK